MGHRFLASTAAAFLLSFGAAQAATVDFDGFSGTSASGTITVAGITVTYDADTFDTVSNPSGPAVNIRFNGDPTAVVVGAGGQGIGVDDAGDPNNDIDGRGDNDIITLAFSEKVRIVDVLFDNVDSSDEVTWFVLDANPGVGPTIAATNTFIPALAGTMDDGLLAIDETGYFLGLGARDRNDDFRIREVRIAPVPLPAAAPMLLLALGGLIALRRRKT